MSRGTELYYPLNFGDEFFSLVYNAKVTRAANEKVLIDKTSEVSVSLHIYLQRGGARLCI